MSGAKKICEIVTSPGRKKFKCCRNVRNESLLYISWAVNDSTCFLLYALKLLCLTGLLIRFVEQLVSSAEAAVEEVVRRGVGLPILYLNTTALVLTLGF